MRTSALRVAALLLVGALGLFLAPARPIAAGDPPLAGITFDRYYTNAELEAALQAMHAAYPKHTRLASMGTSREGRPLWVLSIFDPDAGDPDEKPAFYADGNTHGNEVQASETCLFLAKHLLTRDDPWVKALRKRVTFHIAPCVNPDSRERFFTTPQDEHSPRRVPRPFDDDRDGAKDEDGPDDLDGDGEILEMRLADPDGDLVTDERDDRLMRAKKPGERGQWRLLGPEGKDDDGDGRLNEDGIGGVDPNRNWPGHWRPEVDQGGAGPYPLSEPETRATALWLLALPHLSGVQSFHNAGRMILRPPAAFTDAEAQMPGEDKRLYDEIGRRGTILLPTYRYMQIREDLYRVFGGFVDWAYVELGTTAFTNELWGGVGREREPGPAIGHEHAPREDGQMAALRWNDVALHGEGFIRWHAVKHPQYGTVELGGWRRFTIRNNPVDFLHDTCAQNALFVLEHASTLPALALEGLAAQGDGSFALTITNSAITPTIHGMARRYGTLPPDRVRFPGTRVGAAVRRVLGGPDVVLSVRGDTVLLPDGVPADGAARLLVFPDGPVHEVVVESKTGGMVRARVP